MSGRKRWVVTSAVGLVIAAGFFVYYSKVIRSPVSEEVLVSLDRPQGGDAGFSGASDLHKKSQLNVPEFNHFNEESFRHSSTMEGRYYELVSAFESGDLSAGAELASLELQCGALSTADGVSAAAADVALSRTESERNSRQAALNELMKYCDLPLDAAVASAQSRSIEKSMRDAAASGDEVAKIWIGVYYGESIDESVALRHVESRVPWIAELAIQGLIASDDERLKSVDHQVFSDWRDTFTSSEIEKLKMAAAKWRACELGAKCGAGGYYQNYECLYGSGYCNPSIGIQDYIRHQFNARQFNAMKRYLEEIQKLATSSH
jgi:hypothetical protein